MQQKILIAEPLSVEGVNRLKDAGNFEVIESTKVLKEDELIEKIGDFDAIIVRSGSKVSAEVIEHAKKLKIIARAGVGIDNVDVKAATSKGILVINAPAGNTTSTAEQTWALILSLARKISWAHQSILASKWDRKAYAGIQLNGKTLGIIGLGRIGTEVLTIGKGFGMSVMAYDPYLSLEQAKLLGVRLSTLLEIYKEADVITIHTPLNAHTKNLITKKELSQMKKTALLINCARGGIVVEEDLSEALKENKILGAAFDTFVKEPPSEDNPLIRLPNFLCTPHLGAATKEAQISVAIETSEGVVDFFKKGITKNAINFPSISPDIYAKSKGLISLCESLGIVLGCIRRGNMKSFEIIFPEALKDAPIHIMKLSAVKGFLEPILSEQINFINALNIAEERGINVKESFTKLSPKTILTKTSGANTIILEIVTEEGNYRVAGTVYMEETIRITCINSYEFDLEPQGDWIMVENKDVPGVVGILGTILGNNNVNIATMQLGRKEKGTSALTCIRLDEPLTTDVLEQIKTQDEIIDVIPIAF